MRLSTAAVCALLAVTSLVPAPAWAEEGNLAVGPFTERGPGVRGHGQVLKKAMAYELSRSKAFTLVADDAAKRAAIQRIHKNNRMGIDEREWVEIGQAIGATHLLLGEVEQAQNICTAFVQLVHLQTRKTRVTRPEIYDCTRYDLTDLAGDLSEQLTGRRASPKVARAHRRPPAAPVKIVLHRNKARVNGREVAMDEAPDAGPKPKPEPEPEPKPKPKPFDPPHEAESPSAVPPPRSVPVDLERWPALQPLVDAEGRPVFNLFALAKLLDRQSMLTAGIILAWPTLFIFIGAFLVRARESLGTAWLRFGLSVSVLSAATALACMLLYRYGFERPLAEDASPLLFGAPFAGLGLWVLGGKMVGVLGHLPLFRQVLWLALLTAGMAAVLLIATQVQMPVLYLGLAFGLVWLGFRLAVAQRQRRASR